MRTPGENSRTRVRRMGAFLTIAVLAAMGGPSLANAAVSSALRDQEGVTLTG